MRKQIIVRANKCGNARRCTVTAETGNSYTMTIDVSSGLNSDGFDVEITDNRGHIIFNESYRYGYNASWSRENAAIAERDYENSIRYKWSNKRNLQPFTGDIIDDLCQKYNINKDDIEFKAGRNTFRGDDVSDKQVQEFINDYIYSCSKSIRNSIKGSSCPKYARFVIKAGRSAKQRFKVFASKSSCKQDKKIKGSYDIDDDDGRYETISTKQVQDFDGFMTDYTLYCDLADETYFCVFGDRDIYTPGDSEHDFECDNYDEAYQWFLSYKGAEDIENSKSANGTKVVGAERGEEFDLPQVDQKFSSKKTAVNGRQGKLPAIFKLISFKPGTINLDYGGGTEDAQAVADAYFEDKDVTNLIYDVYNQTAQHNRDVVKQIRANGGADTSTLSNVLNVIAEPESRLNVLKNIKSLLKANGTLYITVYEGAKANRGSGKQTGEDQYQTNMALADYLEEVQQVFPGAKRKGKMIIAPNGSGNVSSSTFVQKLDIPGLSNVVASEDFDIDITEVYNAAADTLDPNAGDVGTFAGPNRVVPSEHFSIVQYDVGLFYVFILDDLITTIDSETGEVLDQADSIADFCEYVERINKGARQMRDQYEGRYSANASTRINAAYSDPEPSLEPPVSREPEELDAETETVEIPFDCVVILHDDSWDYEDESYDWAAGPGSDGSWYSEETGVFLGDKGTMVECIDDLLMTRLPAGSGRYRISGTAILAFNVSGVDKYSDFGGLDEDGDPIIDEELDTSYADSNFEIQESTIEDFQCQLLK